MSAGAKTDQITGARSGVMWRDFPGSQPQARVHW
jgi:hypothetical protein